MLQPKPGRPLESIAALRPIELLDETGRCWKKFSPPHRLALECGRPRLVGRPVRITGRAFDERCAVVMLSGRRLPQVECYKEPAAFNTVPFKPRGKLLARFAYAAHQATVSVAYQVYLGAAIAGVE